MIKENRNSDSDSNYDERLVDLQILGHLLKGLVNDGVLGKHAVHLFLHSLDSLIGGHFKSVVVELNLRLVGK